MLSVVDNNHQPQQQPAAIPALVVQAGSLMQYESQIEEDTVINVHKQNGTLDNREGDLKELCLDWLFFRAKILEYVSEGKSDKANEARRDFNSANLWLDEYNESDVQTMFSIIEKNNWSNW